MFVKRLSFVLVLVLLSNLSLVQGDDEEVSTIEVQNKSEEIHIDTAVATVKEGEGDPVPLNMTADSTSNSVSTNGTTPDNSTSSEDEKKEEAPVKPAPPVRVQVACWDYRNIHLYPDPEPPIVKEEGTPNNETTGTLPVKEVIVAEEPAEQGEEEGGIDSNDNIDAKRSKNDGGTSEETSSGSASVDAVVDVGVEGDNPKQEDVEHDLQDGEGSKVEIARSRTVELVNVSYLMNDVLYQNPAVRSKSVPGNCTVVLFHAAWCPFSAKAAPHYNALPRAYPPLRVAAIDVQKWKTVNTFFGILGVPTIALFHNGRLIAKFNDSQFTLNKFSEFIEYFTDLKHEERMNVTAKDFEGPVKSVPERDKDWLLLLAWIFLLLAGTHYITKSIIWWRFVEFVRATWREAELQVQPQQQQHEHID